MQLITKLLPDNLDDIPERLPDPAGKRQHPLIAAWLAVRRVASTRSDADAFLAGADCALLFMEIGLKRWRERWNPHFIEFNTRKNRQLERERELQAHADVISSKNRAISTLEKKAADLAALVRKLENEPRPVLTVKENLVSKRATVDNQALQLRRMHEILNNRSRYQLMEDKFLTRLRKLMNQPSEELRTAIMVVQRDHPEILALYKNWLEVEGTLRWLEDERDDSVLESEKLLA